MTFRISIYSFMVSWTICWADELGPLSQEEDWHISVSEHLRRTELIDQIIAESDSTTAISNSDDKNTTLCD